MKGIYGLPQASRCWHETMSGHMSDVGFAAAPMEPCIFVRKTPAGIVMTGVHVDG